MYIYIYICIYYMYVYICNVCMYIYIKPCTGQMLRYFYGFYGKDVLYFFRSCWLKLNLNH